MMIVDMTPQLAILGQALIALLAVAAGAILLDGRPRRRRRSDRRRFGLALGFKNAASA